ncbi:MAG: sensor domain-containing diguanylate cyclase [Deltaproteobacteria bacterium]|jgi:diguanylate cyclase (GGDEF)-like protein|nr:sensor domain-containing diguanylate cyclase [Deltaproteobacteria bacterium]
MEPSRADELARENDSLRRAVTLIHEIAKLVRESLELEPTCYAVLTGVTAGVGLGLNRAMLFFVDESDRRLLRGQAAVGPKDAAEADRVWRSIEAAAPDLQTLHEAGLRQQGSPGPLDRWVRETRIDVEGDSPVALALRRGATVRGVGTDDLDGLLHLPTAVAAPLRGRELVRGVLYADNRYTGRQLDPVTELVFSLVADHAGQGIDSAHQYEQVARQARTDALTGLGHHGAMMEAVIAAITSAKADGHKLGLAMLDLDDFKLVNDTIGHLAGDALLAGVAARLRAQVRSGERAFRYGGEEFAVLLPQVDRDALQALGERLRRALGERPYPIGGGRVHSITCSVGLAELGEGRDDARSLIDAADQALLVAKSTGKNRVELAT